MASTTTRLTIDDYERLPQEVAERHELVDGELVEVSGNNLKHNLFRDYLVHLFRLWIGISKIGMVVSEQEFDFLGDAHAPDVAYFGNEKFALPDDTKRVQRFVPDLAVEIGSPNNTLDELLRKKDRYLKSGVAEVWLIPSEHRELYVYTRSGDRILRSDALITSDLLPGFSITVNDLFNGI